MENRQPYKPEIIQRIYEQLCFLEKQGQCRDYEIRLDQFTVVPRTNIPGSFFNYEACIDEWTKEVSIWLYKGASRVADKYTFVLKEEINEGGYTQAQVEALIARTKRDFAQGLEMSELRQKIKRQKKTIKSLKVALQTNQNDSSGQVANLISSLGKSPLFEGVLLSQDQTQQTAKGLESTGSNQLHGYSTDQLAAILEEYRLKIGEMTFQTLIGTTLMLAEHPELIVTVRNLINQHLNNESKEKV